MKLMLGNCLDKLKELEDNSVDSVVTDPPYGLSFMGKKWDYDVPAVKIWEECFRVLKPGGHLLAFAGTRTQHRMAVNIEDAGFEIRDMIAWVYGSGFPKSHNISKAIDKIAGAEREVVGVHHRHGGGTRNMHDGGLTTASELPLTAPATPEAQQWDGWGTALKPALEPITVARKPIAEKSIAENVLKYGTGAINIDESRIATDWSNDPNKRGFQGKDSQWADAETGTKTTDNAKPKPNNLGRFPANLIHDGSDEVLDLFPETKNGGKNKLGKTGKSVFGNTSVVKTTKFSGDQGSAARFFYCAKASKSDRNEGLDTFKSKVPAAAEFRPNHTEKAANGEDGNPYGRWSETKNIHPTVKPTDLMKYLIRLVTPKDGVVLDPFMGSGSTGKAAKIEGFDFIGIELDEEYFQIAQARIDAVKKPITLEEFF